MLNETIDALQIQPNGRYVDVTFGGGGHSAEILNRLDQGTLIAFDRDRDAKENLPNEDRVVFIDHNFQYLKNFLKFHELIPVDGILADLGISSHQIDVTERGFSFRGDAELDMRMDRQHDLTASDVLNTYSEEHLVKIFSEYGELPLSKKLARLICGHRTTRKFSKISDLTTIADGLVPPKKRNRYLAQLFQALRIEVNQEMEALRKMLESTPDVMASGGRLVILSYHSLEDRMVKNFLNTGNVDGIQNKDSFGNLIRPFKPVTRKPVMATEEEIERNPRARSAKMRVGERL